MYTHTHTHTHTYIYIFNCIKQKSHYCWRLSNFKDITDIGVTVKALPASTIGRLGICISNGEIDLEVEYVLVILEYDLPILVIQLKYIDDGILDI